MSRYQFCIQLLFSGCFKLTIVAGYHQPVEDYFDSEMPVTEFFSLIFLSADNHGLASGLPSPLRSLNNCPACQDSK